MKGLIRTYSRANVGQLVDDIQLFFKMDPKAKLDVQRHQESRSGKQQAKLHTLIREVANHVGLDEEHFKQDVLKRNSEGVFASWPHVEVKNLKGEMVMTPKSESKLTKAEEAHVINMIYVLGGDWGMSWMNAA